MRIAIDGPSGAGKSSLAKELARRLELAYVDTGALYRTVGLYASRTVADVKDAAAVAASLGGCELAIRFIDGAQAHALIPLGAWRGREPNWGGRGLKRTPEYLADYVSIVNANDGVVTIDVHVDPDGTWDPEQLEALKAVGRRTGTLRQ